MATRRKYRYTNPFNLDEMNREKDSIHSVPLWIGFVSIIILGGVLGIVILIDGILPTDLLETDESNYPHSFIAERAVHDLKYLTDLGPKISGSYENEYAVIEFLIIKIKEIISNAHSNQYIEYDIQSVTGGYFLDDAIGYMNVYDKVQNVIVKLHGKNNDTEHSILLNSHFDSVPSSPGGSDDGINVVTMLEILRKLSKYEDRQTHNIIFLFNGAEETPLQAAHGYIAHHKWAKESKVLINLESSGAEGKIILFQTGPQTPWLVKYYSKVPHPYGSVTGEEMFQSGLIPSDTDFRVFRDFGNMVGLDMAFFRNGYRYHTKFDGFSNIPFGSYQHVGDNTLSLVKSISNAPEVLEKERSRGKSTYFDVFGWFFISYTNYESRIINLVVMVLSVGVFMFSLFSFGLGASIFKYLLLAVGFILLGWIFSGIFVICLGFLLDIINKTMSWYANPWLIIGLYVLPVTGISGCLMIFIKQKNLSLGPRSQIQAHLVRLIWTMVLAVGVILEIRSIFLLTISILFNSLGFIIIHFFRLQYTVRTWQIIYLASQLIPTSFIIYQFLIAVYCFVPITGRMGGDSNPELIIGALTLLYTLLFVTPFTAVTNLLRNVKWYYTTLAIIFLIFFGLIFTPIGFPYSGNVDNPRPQRHWIMHTQREFYNESGVAKSDSGIFMLNMDRNSPRAVSPYIKQLSNMISLKEDCEQYSLCAMPLTHAKAAKRVRHSVWLPAGVPTFPKNESLEVSVVNKQQLSPTLIKYTVQISGPDKLIIYVTPKRNTKFIATSLIDSVKPTIFSFHDRPIYVILYQLGKSDGTKLKFDFTMETSEAHSGPALDLAVSARYVHEGRMQRTPEFMEFLNQFPEWTDVTSWLAAYQSYEI